MRSILCILLCLTGTMKVVSAQEYATSKIPASLRVKAEIVVRDEQRNIKVFSKTKVVEEYKVVFTILNKQGDNYSTVSEYYDKGSSLKNLKVVVYDSLGIKSKSYSKSDFKDQSQISGSTMYQDDRVLYLTVHQNNYPYTIEFSYTKDINSNFFIQPWRPQPAYNFAVQNSNFKISYPNNLPLKYKESNINNKAETSSDASFTTISYSCQNLNAIEHEDLSVGFTNITPWAYFSPKDFSFENTEGDMSTWSTFGNWVYELSKNGDQLPPETASLVHQLTDGLRTPEEKVKKLYNYMQSKTRYISVQLGIGGFKPFPAEKVAINNYGDCKALSNYMKALLKEAKIPSELVVVKAGNNKDLWADFSAIGQANHMILCVPMVKDTVWLECTSQRNPYNYLGSFTGDRNVVLISEKGGKVVKTPMLNAKDNFKIRKAKVTIDTDGNAVCNISTKFGGEQFENYHDQLFEEPKEQKDYIYKYIGIRNPEITNLKYIQDDQNTPALEQSLDLKASKIMGGLGNNFFLALNLMNKREYVPQVYEQRKTNFSISYSFYDRDEISYELPAGFKIDFLPEDQEIKSEFGIYKTKIKNENNTIVYSRELEMWKKEYAPSEYSKLINFYTEVYKADKQKAVIVKM